MNATKMAAASIVAALLLAVTILVVMHKHQHKPIPSEPNAPAHVRTFHAIGQF